MRLIRASVDLVFAHLNVMQQLVERDEKLEDVKPGKKPLCISQTEYAARNVSEWIRLSFAKCSSVVHQLQVRVVDRA